MAYHDKSGYREALRANIIKESADQEPFDAARHCLLKLTHHYEAKDAMTRDRIFRSTEVLRMRRLARTVDTEEILFAGMCELWPEPEQRARLRLVAMVSIGALRVAMERWRQEAARHRIAKYLRETFAALKTGVIPTT